MRNLVVSDLHSEAKGSWFESGQCLGVCEAGGNANEELKKCPPLSRAVLRDSWMILQENPGKKNKN